VSFAGAGNGQESETEHETERQGMVGERGKGKGERILYNLVLHRVNEARPQDDRLRSSILICSSVRSSYDTYIIGTVPLRDDTHH
jgi:hypothetical protein